MIETRDTVILGSGCSGLTAAIYSARAGMKPLVLEGHEPGGQLSITTMVGNFPGWPDGIQGPDLIENMKKQAARFGADFQLAHLDSVDLQAHPGAPSGSVRVSRQRLDRDVRLDAGHPLQRVDEYLSLEFALVIDTNMPELGTPRALKRITVDARGGPDVRLPKFARLDDAHGFCSPKRLLGVLGNAGAHRFTGNRV